MYRENLNEILEFISKKASENFAILTAEDLAYEIGLNLTESELLNAFNELKTKGNIYLKYNDGKCFCCMITDRGKDLLERLSLPVSCESKIYDKLPYFLIFISAFLGGVLGGGILLIVTLFL